MAATPSAIVFVIPVSMKETDISHPFPAHTITFLGNDKSAYGDDVFGCGK